MHARGPGRACRWIHLGWIDLWWIDPWWIDPWWIDQQWIHPIGSGSPANSLWRIRLCIWRARAPIT
jgi:hypothetical protein